ncbi:protein of unknown function [Alcaligenes faecalis subsp. faecalis]|nr:protein of unknown function [Alcaligenes faecalis subsp. faecalis]
MDDHPTFGGFLGFDDLRGLTLLCVAEPVSSLAR